MQEYTDILNRDDICYFNGRSTFSNGSKKRHKELEINHKIISMVVDHDFERVFEFFHLTPNLKSIFFLFRRENQIDKLKPHMKKHTCIIFHVIIKEKGKDHTNSQFEHHHPISTVNYHYVKTPAKMKNIRGFSRVIFISHFLQVFHLTILSKKNEIGALENMITPLQVEYDIHEMDQMCYQAYMENTNQENVRKEICDRAKSQQMVMKKKQGEINDLKTKVDEFQQDLQTLWKLAKIDEDFFNYVIESNVEKIKENTRNQIAMARKAMSKIKRTCM
jgi:hypothetical protein